MTDQADSALIGSRIGVYRIDSILGAGGMGDVYRAHDTRLRRDVAVKILKQTVSKDPERLARLEREARALAALNHPNIAGIHGLEEGAFGPALILELVEGETLAACLRKGPLSVAEGVRVARQIAGALDAAHEKGIIHRDLKPANIKITPLGTVKVLDFGLAKLEGDGNADLTNAPTATAAHTRDGAILGTVGYMSPEQARGRPLDKRTDIWSFGCVLYEMLTGRLPFREETIADTLAAILERDPDWSLVPSTVPENIRLLLHRCLEKDPRERLRDIGDVWFELDRSAVPQGPLVDGRADSQTAAPRAHRSYASLALRTGVVVLVAAVGAVLVLRGGWPRRDVSEPPVQLTDFNDSVIAPSLSHDGRMLAFIRGADFGRTAASSGRVYVKLLPNGVPVELTHGPGGAGYPTFSPDDARIVYTVVMPGLKWDSWQVRVLGGPPQPFLPNASGLVWLDERRLLYSSIRSGLHMGIVSSTEARSEETTIYFPSSNDGMAHRSAPSPDGKSLLVVEMDRGTWQPCRLVPTDGSSAGRSVSPPGAQCTSAAWSPDGRWMYFSSNAGGEYHIWRQRYPDGAPDQITFGPTEEEGTAITPDGKYLITSMGLQRAGVWLVDADGEHALTDEGYAMFPTMTPSGARLFYLVRTQSSQGKASGELWSLDVQKGTRQRILPEFVMANYSVSQDEKRVVFSSSGNERGDGIWIADLDRGSPPRHLVRGTEVRAFFGAPGEIVYLGEGSHVYRMKDDGSGGERVSANPVVYLVTVSPDGRWAVTITPRSERGGGTRMEFMSLRGERSFPVCNDACRLGPRSLLEVLPFNWSLDAKWLFVNLRHFGKGTRRTVVLPYRPDASPELLWPKGLTLEEEVMANPDARVIDATYTFPAAGQAYLSWRASMQSNLYRIRIPN